MSSNRKISKSDVPAFIDFLRKQRFEVIAPVEDEVGIVFRTVKSGNETTMNYLNTTYSPKEFFLPDDEILFEYKKKGRGFELKDRIKNKRRVIFGIRPCDVHGLLILDKLFIEDLKDPYYAAKRKNTLIIAVNCNKAGKHCFCKSMGTDILKNGFDLLMTDMGDKYFVEVGTNLGKRLIKSKLFKPASKRSRRKGIRYNKKFNAKNVEKKLLKVFDDRRWEKVSKKCLSCGACTLICPTCYCFNVIDRPDFDGSGVRKKVSSYCMLLEFSRVAGGGVFRKDRTERCKQFVYHKLSYFKEKFGRQLCVGCGRCIEICPVNIDFFDGTEKILRGSK
jgi:ferredoxin